MKKIITLVLGISLMSVLLVAQTSEQNQNDTNPLPNRPGQSEQNHRPGHQPGMNYGQNHDCDQSGNHGQHQGQNNGMGIWSRLDLNRTQHAEISRMVERFRAEQTRSRNAMRQLRTELREAMMNENFRRARNLNRRINSLRENMSEARLNHHERIMNQLNREQKAQLRSIMEDMRGRMQNRRQGRGMGQGNHQGRGAGQGNHQGSGAGQGDCDDCDDCEGHGSPRTQQN